MPYEIKIQERLPQLGTILFFSDGDREVSVIEAAVGVVFVTVSSRRVFGGELAEAAVLDDFRRLDFLLERLVVVFRVVLVEVVDGRLKSRQFAFVRRCARQSRRHSKNWRDVEFDRVGVQEEGEGEGKQRQQVISRRVVANVHEGHVEMEQVVHVVEEQRHKQQRKQYPHYGLKRPPLHREFVNVSRQLTNSEEHENCRDERREFESTTGDDEHVRVAQQHRQIDPGHQLPREIPAHLCPPVSSLFPPVSNLSFLFSEFSWN